MGYNYPLLSQVLGAGKRQTSDRQRNAEEIRRTAKFHECNKCGETWPLDEGDTCDWCEPTE